MDAWHFLVVSGAFVAAGKWYMSCQMRYWASPECKTDWDSPRAHGDDTGQGKQEPQDHGIAGSHLRRRGVRFLLGRSALRKIGRPAIGGRR